MNFSTSKLSTKLPGAQSLQHTMCTCLRAVKSLSIQTQELRLASAVFTSTFLVSSQRNWLKKRQSKPKNSQTEASFVSKPTACLTWAQSLCGWRRFTAGRRNSHLRLYLRRGSGRKTPHKDIIGALQNFDPAVSGSELEVTFKACQGVKHLFNSHSWASHGWPDSSSGPGHLPLFLPHPFGVSPSSVAAQTGTKISLLNKAACVVLGSVPVWKRMGIDSKV